MPIHRTAHIISHTHWDREWYLNSPFTNAWLVPFFDALFAMLEKEPGYRFVLDGQTALVEDWCDQLTALGRDAAAHRQRLSGYVRQGRVLVGPYYLQPDWQLVSEEALVRNLLIGAKLADELGGRMPVGWLLDNFGQISQAAQIHAGFGLDSLFVWRGVEMDPREVQSEFTWEAPDGSRVLAVYLVSSYRNAMRLAEYRQAMAGRIRREVGKLALFATTPNVVLMNGYDQEMQPDDILPVMRAGLPGLEGVQVVQSTPPDVVQAVRSAAPPLKVLRGALYSGRFISVFPGVLSSRMYLKTQNDACQKWIERGAEPFSALLWGLGAAYPAAGLEGAWKLLLKNHPHDSICGVSVDNVHTDMEARLSQSMALAKRLAHQALARLAANVNTGGQPGAQACWLVANPGLRPASGMVTLEGAGKTGLYFVDSAGKPLACQPLVDGACLVDVQQVPGLGYETIYQVQPSGTLAEDSTGLRVDRDRRVLENAWVKLLVGPDGCLELTDKASPAVYRDLAVYEDGGDAGDTYNYSYPGQDRVVTNRGSIAAFDWLETGPLRARLAVRLDLDVPAGLAPERGARSSEPVRLPILTEITLEAGSPLVQFKTVVRNTARDHRLRVLFPTGIAAAVSNAESQFDVVTRTIVSQAYDEASIPAHVREVIVGAREPRPVTIFPQRTFVDLNDGARGLAVLNRGLPEFEVLPEHASLALTLFRGVGWIARPDLLTRIGDAGPLIAVPGAQCLRDMVFEFALLPHAGDWQSGQVLRIADQYNGRLWVTKAGLHPGSLAPEAGYLQLDDPSGQLKVTAVKAAEDGQGLIVRFFNPTQGQLPARVQSGFRLAQAWRTNLAETSLAPLAVEGEHAVQVSAAPGQIVTLKLAIVREDGAPALPDAEQESGLPNPAGNDRFPDVALPAAITPPDMDAEAARAANLEAELVEQERALQAYLAQDAQDLLKAYQLRLEAATQRRTALEARLSETLLRMNAAGPDSRAAFEARLRQIGDAINTARVEKRALEYVVDYYARQGETR